MAGQRGRKLAGQRDWGIRQGSSFAYLRACPLTRHTYRRRCYHFFQISDSWHSGVTALSEDVTRSALFLFLKASDEMLHGKLLDVRKRVTDWLQYIPATFPHYTRHSVVHSDSIIEQVSRILFDADAHNAPAGVCRRWKPMCRDAQPISTTQAWLSQTPRK